MRDHIIDLLGQTVTVVRAEVTLEMRADVIVILQQEIKLGMTEMIVIQYRSRGNYRSSDRNAEIQYNGMDQSRRDNDQNNGQPLFVDYDSTPIQVMPSNLPSTRLEANPTVQTVTSIPAVDSTTQSARVEEPTLKSGTTPTVENNSLVFPSQPHNT